MMNKLGENLIQKSMSLRLNKQMVIESMNLAAKQKIASEEKQEKKELFGDLPIQVSPLGNSERTTDVQVPVETDMHVPVLTNED